MSPTRKPKPPDKGAPPEHKPSRKVALEEVMRSLQDLVSNELATDKPLAATPTKPGPADKQAVSRSAFTADVLPAVPPVVIESSAEPEPVAADHAAPAQPPPVIPDAFDELPNLGAEPPPAVVASPPAATGSTIPAEGLQQELPYLEDIPPAASVNPPAPAPEAAAFLMAELPLEDQTQNEPPLVEVKPGNIADSDALAPASMNAAVPDTAETMNWDDIPVLDEAVDMAEETDVGGAAHGMAASQAALLPPAAAAHRLAIQVAARLNVELRKSGQGGLSSDVITRLARLLQEALAKGAPNMENTKTDKH